MGSDGLVLELTRVLPADRETIFAAFTDPGELVQWWGPEGFSIPSADFDPRPGAEYCIEMQPPEGELFFLRGEVRDAEPPRRLAYTFVWDPPDPEDVETLVELEFADGGPATTVDFRQGEFVTEARLQLHRDGWTDTFNKLERYLRE
jgi:uncharacterized protein YndB with AHSA1/START domain